MSRASSVSMDSRLDSQEKAPYKTTAEPYHANGELDNVIDAAQEDLAAKYANTHVALTPELEKRVKWKADLYVCSMMCFVTMIQFMDKVSNGSAAVMGLRTDLEMKGKMYSWVGSSLYLGYMVFELPVALCIQRFPLAKATSLFIVAWGLVLACASASQNYSGFISTRVLLGALEGAINPSFLILTSQWWKVEEQFSRICLWYAWNGAGTLMGSAIAYGLVDHEASYSLAAWRILFLILGCITIVTGIAFWFIIPDSPASAWFFNEEERAAHVERIRENKTGYGTRKIKWDQVVEVFKDPRTYLHFAIVFVFDVPNGGVTNFQAILFEGMGFGTKATLRLGMCNGAVELVGCTLTALCSMYFFKKYRMVYANICGGICFMCLCLLAWAPNNSGKMAGLMLWYWAGPVSYFAVLSCISSNVAGSTKKSVSTAVILIGFCVGNLVGPQTFKADQAPKYASAKVGMAVCGALQFGLLLALTALNWYENKRRDRKNEKLPENMINAEFADLTDMQNPEFRYAL